MHIGQNASFMDPRTVITHFHLRPGDVVADFGSGAGHYLKVLNDAVSPGGTVYACEIQKGLVEKLTQRAHEERLGNVHPIWCDFEAPGGTKLRDELLDVGMLVNTLYQIENKAAALTEMKRIIRKGGRLFLVEWADSFGGIGPHPSQVVKQDAAKALFEAQGFVFEREFPAADHHYGFVFKKQ